MSAFEYIFTFYGLLIGLAAANVTTGLADAWRDRRTVSLGYCVPLLTLIVLMLIMRLWVSFWSARPDMVMAPELLIAAACTALPYIFLSRIIFPGPGGATSLEDHFFAHRRTILVAIVLPAFVSILSNLFISHEWPPPLWLALRPVIPLALLPFDNRVANRVGLTLFAAQVAWALFA